jgi:hypothetical protein
METGELLKLGDIEEAWSSFRKCPRCSCSRGFWLSIRRDKVYVQCKECGAQLELFEVYRIGEKGRAPEKVKLFRL